MLGSFSTSGSVRDPGSTQNMVDYGGSLYDVFVGIFSEILMREAQSGYGTQQNTCSTAQAYGPLDADDIQQD